MNEQAGAVGVPKLFTGEEFLDTSRFRNRYFSVLDPPKPGDQLEENLDAWYPVGQAELELGVGDAKFSLGGKPAWDNCHGLVTPIDHETGLPVPVLITDPPSPGADTTFVDYHHLFHPEAVLIHGDDADIALRRSYGQDLPRWLHEHNHGYFAGPTLPNTRMDKFISIALACSGVVPRSAIEFTRRGPFRREHLTDVEYARVTNSVRYEGKGKSGTAGFYKSQIGMFFANYAIEQSVEDVVSDRVIDEFLETKAEHRRTELGNLLLRECIKMSVEPVRPIHSNLRKRGLLPGIRTDLEPRIVDFFVRSRRKDYHVALERKWRPEVELITA